jgi:membrane protease YdiL (CAAX protease family)
MRLRRRAAVLATAAIALLAASGTAWAEDPPPSTDIATADELMKATLGNPAVLVAMALCKFLPAIAGLVLLCLDWSNWSVRPRLPKSVRPTAPVGPAFAFALGLGAYFASGVGATLVKEVHPEWLDHLATHVLLTAIPMVVVAVVVIVGRATRRERASLLSAFAAREGMPPPVPPPPRPGPLAAVGSGFKTFLEFAFLSLGIAIGLQVLLSLFDVKPELQGLVKQVIKPKDESDPWLITIFGILVAPFTEECLFRGLLYPALRSFAPRVTSMVVVSALFALMHLEHGVGVATLLPAVTSLFVFAMMLARLFEKTDSLFAVVTAHALNNATSLIPILVLRSHW